MIGKKTIWKLSKSILNPNIGEVLLCRFRILRYVTTAYIYDKHKSIKFIYNFRNKVLTKNNIGLLYRHTYETER